MAFVFLPLSDVNVTIGQDLFSNPYRPTDQHEISSDRKRRRKRDSKPEEELTMAFVPNKLSFIAISGGPGQDPKALFESRVPLSFISPARFKDIGSFPMHQTIEPFSSVGITTSPTERSILLLIHEKLADKLLDEWRR